MTVVVVFAEPVKSCFSTFFGTVFMFSWPLEYRLEMFILDYCFVSHSKWYQIPKLYNDMAIVKQSYLIYYTEVLGIF
jgi:hypothetical protein